MIEYNSKPEKYRRVSVQGVICSTPRLITHNMKLKRYLGLVTSFVATPRLAFIVGINM